MIANLADDPSGPWLAAELERGMEVLVRVQGQTEDVVPQFARDARRNPGNVVSASGTPPLLSDPSDLQDLGLESKVGGLLDIPTWVTQLGLLLVATSRARTPAGAVGLVGQRPRTETSGEEGPLNTGIAFSWTDAFS